MFQSPFFRRVVGHGRKLATRSLTHRTRRFSVPVCKQQPTGITGLLPIRLRSGLACLVPGRFQFLGYARGVKKQSRAFPSEEREVS